MRRGRAGLLRLGLAWLGVFGPLSPAVAQPAGTAAVLPGTAVLGGPCGAAIAAAEQRQGIPPGLLAAIAVVESGRPGPLGPEPWPWTINVNGQGRFYADGAAAVADTRRLQAAGQVSIDVGCLQVNLRHHPAAFASLEDAFDPVTNASYAARFLAVLRDAAGGDWMEAAGAYHSAIADRAGPYRQRVQAALIRVGAGDVGAFNPLRALPRPVPTPAATEPAPRRNPAGTNENDWLLLTASTQERARLQAGPMLPGRAMAMAAALDSLGSTKATAPRPGR